MTESQSTARTKAKAVAAGLQQVDRDQLFALVRQLKAERAFGLARRILDRYAGQAAFNTDESIRINLAQQRALCTYKDPDLPGDEKLDQALEILRGIGLDGTKDRETLGLAGAIYKRRWELSAQERDLEVSFAYYYRGYAEGEGEDYGYTGINAAFVLDLLADHESVAAANHVPGLDTPAARRALSAAIRQSLIIHLSALLAAEPALRRLWWFLTTLAEANYGLEDYPAALQWLLEANMLPDVPDWERESTARQLATLFLLKQKAGRGNLELAKAVLREWLGNDYALTSVIRGKVGVGLSGGGFRASLFHIGLLARLAELDLLRSVEYLSCVSGGSIIGAYYYLEVRHLLQSKADDDITREDYVGIVRRIEERFVKGVQRNIRTRLLAEWSTNLKMMFKPDYSRTARAGELYERELFSRIEDGEADSERWLNKMLVMPLGEQPGFSPKDHNWRRSNKVPILVLNATALNTGHNWQFTATWMGEPPAGIDSEIDANYRLRRLYYDEAPEGNQNVRLGHAVAASACVPGIFDPLSLTGLYERRDEGKDVKPIVRLVDGGVHDNQGTGALLEQGCNVLVVSDASGQMDALDFPGSGSVAVPLRANSILQARVREAQYRELSARRRAGLLKGLLFIHLKEDLDIEPVDWIGAQDPSPPASTATRTHFGVQKDIQRSLAAIRTDLDSFSDAEACGLMCDAYMMSDQCLKSSSLGFELPPEKRERWEFLRLQHALGEPDRKSELRRQLRAGHRLFFRIWSLSKSLKVVGIGIVAALVLGLTYLVISSWDTTLIEMSVGEVVLDVGPLILSLLGVGLIAQVFNYRKTTEQFLVGLGLVVVGAALARLHLHVFDKLFLRQGRLDRIVDKDTGPAAGPPGGAIKAVPLVSAQAVAAVDAEKRRNVELKH